MQRDAMKTSSQISTLIKICLTLPPLSLAWRMASYKKYETLDTIMIAAAICGMVIKIFDLCEYNISYNDYSFYRLFEYSFFLNTKPSIGSRTF